MSTGVGTSGAMRRLGIDPKKYRAVPRERETPKDSEIHVSNVGDVGMYVLKAVELFNKENRMSVVVRGSGYAVSVAVIVAELIRNTVPGMHKVMQTGVAQLVDVYEPLEPTVEPHTVVRKVPYIAITLLKEAPASLAPGQGYAPPPTEEESKAVQLSDLYPTRSRPVHNRGARQSTRGPGNR